MNDRDRLIELVKPFASGSACEQESGVCEFKDCKTCNAECIATNLLANGVIVPPCKVGDVVYVLVAYGCDCYTCDDNCVECENATWECVQTGFELYMYYEIGKTVFLTKEEAEAELRKRGKDNV